MSRTLILLHSAIFGIACMYAGFHQPAGFILYMIWGLITSFPVIIKRLFIAAAIGAFVTILCIIIPVLLPILPLLLLIPLLMKLASILKNSHLIILGIVLYVLLLTLPAHIQQSLTMSWQLNETLVRVLLALLGAVVMGLIATIAKKRGTEATDFSFFVIGLPGFVIFLFLPGNDIDA